MASAGALQDLQDFAVTVAAGGVRVHRAIGVLDERQDGEPVTRLALLLDEPEGDTWATEVIRELRISLARHATELDLPPVSLTLVPESEAEVLESFPVG